MNEDASRRVFPKYIITAVLFLLINAFAFAQLPTPQLVSLSVEANGSISASWTSPTGTFDGYRLFYRIPSPGTPFNSIDFPASSTSGIIAVTDAQTVGYEAFITTYTNAGASSGNSNTLNSMILIVSKIGTGTARLDWNRMIQGQSVL